MKKVIHNGRMYFNEVEFRALPVAEIIELTQKAAQEGLELVPVQDVQQISNPHKFFSALRYLAGVGERTLIAVELMVYPEKDKLLEIQRDAETLLADYSRWEKENWDLAKPEDVLVTRALSAPLTIERLGITIGQTLCNRHGYSAKLTTLRRVFDWVHACREAGYILPQKDNLKRGRNEVRLNGDFNNANSYVMIGCQRVSLIEFYQIAYHLEFISATGKITFQSEYK